MKYDLDLVLKKYHKKDKNLYKKNKDTNPNEVDWRQSHLFYASSWPRHFNLIFASKFLPIKSFFFLFISEFSFFSLLFLLTWTIPLVFCQIKLTTLVFKFAFVKRFFSSPFFSHNFNQVISHKIMISIYLNSENVSTDLLFQIFFVIFLWYVWILRRLLFERVNVRKFWQKFENICNDYQMSTSKKICCLPWYYKKFTA